MSTIKVERAHAAHRNVLFPFFLACRTRRSPSVRVRRQRTRLDAHRPRRKPWQWVSAVACCFAHLNVYLIIGGIGDAPRLLIHRRAIAREMSEPNGRRDAIAGNEYAEIRMSANKSIIMCFVWCLLLENREKESRVPVLKVVISFPAIWYSAADHERIE